MDAERSSDLRASTSYREEQCRAAQMREPAGISLGSARRLAAMNRRRPLAHTKRATDYSLKNSARDGLGFGADLANADAIALQRACINASEDVALSRSHRDDYARRPARPETAMHSQVGTEHTNAWSEARLTVGCALPQSSASPIIRSHLVVISEPKRVGPAPSHRTASSRARKTEPTWPPLRIADTCERTSAYRSGWRRRSSRRLGDLRYGQRDR
jgi:hypothetical protein